MAGVALFGVENKSSFRDELLSTTFAETEGGRDSFGEFIMSDPLLGKFSTVLKGLLNGR